MLDQRKIAVMARLAVYEKGAGKGDIRISSYSNLDYVRYEILKTFFRVTAAMALILFMLAAYKADYFVKQVTSENYQLYLFFGAAVYLVVLFFSEIAAVFSVMHRYRQSKGRLKEHYNNLRSMRRYYREEEQEKEQEKE